MAERISKEEFRKSIQTPIGFVNFILDHNLPAVNQNIISMGLVKNPVDRESAYSIIKRLADSGRNKEIQQILAVPLNPNHTNGTEEYLGEIVDVARAWKIKPVSAL